MDNISSPIGWAWSFNFLLADTFYVLAWPASILDPLMNTSISHLYILLIILHLYDNKKYKTTYFYLSIFKKITIKCNEEFKISNLLIEHSHIHIQDHKVCSNNEDFTLVPKKREKKPPKRKALLKSFHNRPRDKASLDELYSEHRSKLIRHLSASPIHS